MSSKIVMYKAMRLQGLRLYASRNWSDMIRMNGCTCKRSISMKYAEEENPTFLESVKTLMGFKGGLRYYPSQLHQSAFRMYLSAAEASRYNRIYDYILLPDNMVSWHRLTSLHIWLFMVRLVSEGRDGTQIRDRLIETFNVDMRAKSKVIGKEMKSGVSSDQISLLYQMFLASLMNYDEGLLGSDKHLAGAIWRSLYGFDPNVDPQHLEIMVAYIRKQVMYLQEVPAEGLLGNGLVPFLPVEGNSIPKSTKDALQELHKAKVQSKG